MVVQGVSWTNVDPAVVGLTWDGRWRGRIDDEDFTQFGITPVLRLYLAGIGPRWLVEAGIGANWISPKYRNDTRVFPKAYNFCDRIGVGRRFGETQAHEIYLGVEHD
jgi:lipid A 3-O-deacylase